MRRLRRFSRHTEKRTIQRNVCAFIRVCLKHRSFLVCATQNIDRNNNIGAASPLKLSHARKRLEETKNLTINTRTDTGRPPDNEIFIYKTLPYVIVCRSDCVPADTVLAVRAPSPPKIIAATAEDSVGFGFRSCTHQPTGLDHDKSKNKQFRFIY